MVEFTGETVDKKTLKLSKKIVKHTMKVCGQKFRKIELCVKFVYDDEIQELNNRTRNVDSPTDVLSFPNLNDVFNRKIDKYNFPSEVDPETRKINIGDIVINLNRAEEQAGSFGHTLTREISYLLVHGCLHLLGYDHIDELDAKLMRSQEELILEKFNLKRG